jgi:hypothetical protein
MVNALELWAAQYPDLRTKVRSSLVFFTNGTALSWANAMNEAYRQCDEAVVFNQAAMQAGTPQRAVPPEPFMDWNHFIAQFRLHFEDQNPLLTAQVWLRNARSGRNSTEMNMFFFDFDKNSAICGYDEQTKIFNLRNALPPAMVAKLIEVASTLVTYEDWKAKAKAFQESWDHLAPQRKKQLEGKRPTQQNATAGSSKQGAAQPAAQVKREPTESKVPPQKQSREQSKCYRCGRLGHFVNECTSTTVLPTFRERKGKAPERARAAITGQEVAVVQGGKIVEVVESNDDPDFYRG